MTEAIVKDEGTFSRVTQPGGARSFGAGYSP
jgi:hypothetical protein